jgi:hypothetical protein
LEGDRIMGWFVKESVNVSVRRWTARNCNASHLDVQKYCVTPDIKIGQFIVIWSAHFSFSTYSQVCIHCCVEGITDTFYAFWVQSEIACLRSIPNRSHSVLLWGNVTQICWYFCICKTCSVLETWFLKQQATLMVPMLSACLRTGTYNLVWLMLALLVLHSWNIFFRNVFLRCAHEYALCSS